MTMFFDADLKFGSTDERNHYHFRYDIDYLEGNPEKRFLFADICQYIKKQPCHFCEPEPVVLDAFLSHKMELGACISAAMAFKDKDSIKELAPQIGADANRLISGL